MPLAYTGSLPEPSNQDQGEVEVVSVLYENGIPQVPDFFYYIDQDTIEIPSENFSASSFFEFRYNRLTRLESQVLDLGPNFLNYEWYLDVCAYIRKNLSTKQETVSEQLRILDGFEATLDNPALTTGSYTLVRTNGVVTEELPPSAVTFITNSRIQIASRFFDIEYIYTFTYTSLVIERNPTVSLVYEYRTAVSPTQVLNKDWKEFQINDLADTRFSLEDPNNKRYIQFRVTANNIKRIEDLHIYSVTARGIPSPQEEVDVLNAAVTGIFFEEASSLSTLTSSAVGEIPATADSAATLSGDAEGAIKFAGDASADMELTGDSAGQSRVSAGPASSTATLTADPAETSKPFIDSTASADMELNEDVNGTAIKIRVNASSSFSLSSASDGLLNIDGLLIDSYSWEEGIEFSLYNVLGSLQVSPADPRPTISYPNANPASTNSVTFINTASPLLVTDYTISTSPILIGGIGNRQDRAVQNGGHGLFGIRQPTFHTLTSSGWHLRIIHRTTDPVNSGTVYSSGIYSDQNTPGDLSMTMDIDFLTSTGSGFTSGVYFIATGINMSTAYNYQFTTDATSFLNADETGSFNSSAGVLQRRNIPNAERWYLYDLSISDTGTDYLFEQFINGSRQTLNVPYSQWNGRIATDFTMGQRGLADTGLLPQPFVFFGWREGVMDLATHQAERVSSGLVYP